MEMASAKLVDVCPAAGAGATNWEGYWEKISKESQGSK